MLASFEKLQAKIAFQLKDLRAQCGLPDATKFCGTHEATQLSYCYQVAQIL